MASAIQEVAGISRPWSQVGLQRGSSAFGSSCGSSHQPRCRRISLSRRSNSRTDPVARLERGPEVAEAEARLGPRVGSASRSPGATQFLDLISTVGDLDHARVRSRRSPSAGAEPATAGSLRRYLVQLSASTRRGLHVPAPDRSSHPTPAYQIVEETLVTAPRFCSGLSFTFGAPQPRSTAHQFVAGNASSASTPSHQRLPRPSDAGLRPTTRFARITSAPAPVHADRARIPGPDWPAILAHFRTPAAFEQHEYS